MKVVLIGCGYVSVWTYKLIAQYASKQLKRGEIEVIVVSDSDYHAFHGFTGEFLNGFLPLEFRSTPFKEIFKYATLLKGRMVAINQIDNSIDYIPENERKTRQLSYDHLVIGTGSTDDLESIYGIKEFGLSIKKHGGIRQCRQKIVQSLALASRATTDEERTKYLSFCVIGGGFAAVEICGNMVELLDLLTKEYPVLKQYGYKVHLIYSSDEILPQLSTRFNLCRKYAKKTLADLQVIMSPNTRVVEIGEDYIKKDNGEIISTIVPICTAGQRTIKFNTEVPFIYHNNRICVDKQLRAEGFANIWTGGDAATVKRPFRDMDCRHDALWAIKHGTRIGKNIARMAKGKMPGSFAYPGLGQTASFYKHKSILEIYGLQFTGILAWYIRIGFFLYFMPSRKFALRVLIYLFKDHKKTRVQHLVSEERVELDAVAV
jgi:NADH dehydrogenase FAD-containing subunit